jgi:hypothetical protein
MFNIFIDTSININFVQINQYIILVQRLRRRRQQKQKQNDFKNNNIRIIATIFDTIQFNSIQFNSIRYDSIQYNMIQSFVMCLYSIHGKM